MARFDGHADSYDAEVDRSVAFAGKGVDFYARLKAEHLLDLARRHLGDPRDLTVLDVGCGVGVTDVHLVSRVGTLHGTDVAADAVARAAARNPEAHYRSYEGPQLPFPDHDVDMAFAVCVAHHVEPPDRPAFARELARVVRPGGMVVVVEHNPLNPLTRLAVNRCEFDEGVELLSRRELTGLVAGAGLTRLERRYITFLPLDGRVAHRLDRALGRVPLGAQHLVAGRRR